MSKRRGQEQTVNTTLRLPESVHASANYIARILGLSLNAYHVQIIGTDTQNKLRDSGFLSQVAGGYDARITTFRHEEETVASTLRLPESVYERATSVAATLRLSLHTYYVQVIEIDTELRPSDPGFLHQVVEYYGARLDAARFLFEYAARHGHPPHQEIIS